MTQCNRSAAADAAVLAARRHAAGSNGAADSNGAAGSSGAAGRNGAAREQARSTSARFAFPRLASSGRCAARLIASATLGLALAGCGMSSITSGLGGGMFGSGSPAPNVKAVTEEQLLSAAKADEGATGATSAGEIAAGCPRFLIWPRENNVTVYETGRVGDGLAIMHRGEITKTARECSVEPGKVTVKYGFSGRVLLGPRGQTGNVELPLNVYVTDAKREKLQTEHLKVDVQVAVDNPIGYFSAVRTVTIPVAEGARAGEYQVFVGFDRNVPGAG